VEDASVLIDLAAVDLLEAWLGLGIETITSSFVWPVVAGPVNKEEFTSY